MATAAIARSNRSRAQRGAASALFGQSRPRMGKSCGYRIALCACTVSYPDVAGGLLGDRGPRFLKSPRRFGIWLGEEADGREIGEGTRCQGDGVARQESADARGQVTGPSRKDRVPVFLNSPPGTGRESSTRKVCGLPYAFGLQQMAALVLRDNFEPRSGCESKHGNERILESNAIDIVIARPTDQFSRYLVAAKKRLKNGRFDLFAWLDFLWCPSPPAHRRRFSVVPNKPATEPARSNFLNPRQSSPL